MPCLPRRLVLSTTVTVLSLPRDRVAVAIGGLKHGRDSLVTDLEPDTRSNALRTKRRENASSWEEEEGYGSDTLDPLYPGPQSHSSNRT